MTIILNVSPELQEELVKLAETQHRSLDDLAEDAIARYIIEQKVQILDRPTEEEIAAVREVIIESDWEDAQGIEITLEEVESELDRLIENYQSEQANT
jgi:predicted transcriptional regulator